MTNYTQTNIYRRQMNELGLNTKQYAQLIDMPYEVVKDMIYDKEGNYSMEIGKILRNNMFNKHQEIENNFEQAKYEAMRIKKEDNEINYFDWYDKEYTKDLLFEKLPVLSITDFEKKYCIIVDGKRASHWFYTILCGKREYDGHYIDIERKRQFLSQLYDILINGNADNYKEANAVVSLKIKQTNDAKYLDKQTIDFYHDWYKKFNCKKFVKDNHISNYTLQRELRYSPAVISRLINKKRYSDNAIVRFYKFVEKINNDIDYFEWFKNFDLKEYMKQHDLNNTTLGMKIGLGIVSTSQLANKKFYTKKTLEKLYNFIKQNEDDIEVINDEIEELDTTDTQLDDSTSDIIDDSTCQIELEEQNEENNKTPMKMIYCGDESTAPIYAPDIEKIEEQQILRRILINRLTDEEKELIRLFGGKIC